MARGGTNVENVPADTLLLGNNGHAFAKRAKRAIAPNAPAMTLATHPSGSSGATSPHATIAMVVNVSFDMLDDQCHHRCYSCRHSFVGSSRHEKSRPEGRLK